MTDIIDWQDLNDRIVYRIWRTNEIEKHDAEIATEIAINEFKKELSAVSVLSNLPNPVMKGFNAGHEARRVQEELININQLNNNYEGKQEKL